MKKKLTQKDLDKIKPENWDISVNNTIDDNNQFSTLKGEEFNAYLKEKYKHYVPEKPIRTLIIYNDLEKELQYTIVEGDFSKFDGVVINTWESHPFLGEFVKWFFDKETGEFLHNMSTDKSLIENKQWDVVAIVTWLP